jgi:hypothetical protein
VAFVADFLAIVSFVAFIAVFLGYIWCLERVQQILRMASENDIDLHVIARRDEPADRPSTDDSG